MSDLPRRAAQRMQALRDLKGRLSKEGRPFDLQVIDEALRSWEGSIRLNKRLTKELAEERGQS